MFLLVPSQSLYGYGFPLGTWSKERHEKSKRKREEKKNLGFSSVPILVRLAIPKKAPIPGLRAKKLTTATHSQACSELTREGS